MAGARFVIDVDDEAVLAALRHAASGLSQPGPLMADIAEYLYTSTRARFNTQTDPDGVAWPALHPRYAETKPKNKAKILTLSGEMRGPRLFPQASDTEAAVVSNAIQARIHNLGGVIRPKNGRALRIGGTGKLVGAVRIPRRQFMGLSDADSQEIIDLTLDYIGQPFTD
ncbi:possible bacteriophage Mu G-like protein [plant metagenome]|uniref:Possible bacteriophage Mu G-like protein n=1 Tax=plant metagenome TaxID=1297885 RepID=A0A484QCH0_9ZZZZ